MNFRFLDIAAFELDTLNGAVSIVGYVSRFRWIESVVADRMMLTVMFQITLDLSMAGTKLLARTESSNNCWKYRAIPGKTRTLNRSMKFGDGSPLCKSHRENYKTGREAFSLYG